MRTFGPKRSLPVFEAINPNTAFGSNGFINTPYWAQPFNIVFGWKNASSETGR
jgi:hypothetical protein